MGVSRTDAAPEGSEATLPGPPPTHDPPEHTDPSDELGVGDRVGRYDILRLLGQGGMGRVFEGRDPELSRPVAIKVLFRRPGSKDATAGAIRLRREAKALAVLSHPNVVQVFDVGSTRGHVWVAMELVEGTTMAAWIEQRRTLREMLDVFECAAAGLAAAHAAGIVHRDFKLANVIVEPNGRARVLDFGLSTAFWSDDLPETTTAGSASVERDPELFTVGFGQRVGTPLYMSPEQYYGETTDARSDQFSFSVAAYLALYGRYPEQVIEQSPRALSARIPDRPTVPKAVARVLTRGMAPEPPDRFGDIHALMTALRRAARPWHARWPARAAAGLVLAGGLTWAAWAVRAPTRCTGAQARVDEVWDDARKDRLGQALAADNERAQRTWGKARERFDAHADQWIRTYEQICEADDPSTLDRRMTCLDRRLASLDGAAVALMRDGARSDAALTAALGLPTPDSCLNALVDEPVPDDPSLAAQVEAVRRSLARVRGMFDAGDYAAVLDKSEPLLAEAESLGYSPLLAEVLAERAATLHAQHDLENAKVLLERSYHEAVSGGHETKALHSAIDLIWVVGVENGDVDKAVPWVRQAEALLERRGYPEGLTAEFNKNKGMLAYARGDYPEALEALNQAIVSMKLSGGDGPPLAGLYNNLAVNQVKMGRLSEAAASYHSALSIVENTYGGDHPIMGSLLTNLGSIQRRMGDPAGSRASLERSIEIITDQLGPQNASLYAPLVNLGNLDIFEGQPGAAIPRAQRALEIIEQSLGADAAQLMFPLDTLGNAYAAAGDHAAAARHFDRAVRLLEQNPESNTESRARAMMGHGVALRELSQTEQARARLREALALLTSTDGDPGTRGEAHQQLALAVEDPAEARTLMRQALVLFEQAEDRAEDIRTTQDWLEQHPAEP